MKQKVVISAGGQAFEFNGEIIELNSDSLVLKAEKGDIYIERKYLVFIQFLDDEPVEPRKEEAIPVVRNQQVDNAIRFVNKKLKQDPLNEKLQEKLIPPSQLPDDNFPPETIVEMNDVDEEDLEAMRNVYTSVHGHEHPVVKAANLKQAIKAAMEDEGGELTMGMGSVKYKDPLQTVLGMKNANSKKTRSS